MVNNIYFKFKKKFCPAHIYNFSITEYLFPNASQCILGKSKN